MKTYRVGDIPLKEPKARTKPLGRVSGILIALTALVSVWLFHEVGLLGFSPVAASEKGEASLETIQRSVQDREKTVASKEESVTRREAALADKETALAEQIKQYERTIQELKERLAAASETKVEEKPDEFLSIYEKMEAKRAAKIFEKLDLPVATRFLKQMSPGRAAEILGLLPAERARQITERHLGRATASAN
jgi:flagellar motility protein MotE (MotC chaperone)